MSISPVDGSADTIFMSTSQRTFFSVVAMSLRSEMSPVALPPACVSSANSAFGVWMTKRGTWANAEAGSLQAAIELENRTQILARTTGDLMRAAEDLLARRKRRGEP